MLVTADAPGRQRTTGTRAARQTCCPRRRVAPALSCCLLAVALAARQPAAKRDRDKQSTAVRLVTLNSFVTFSLRGLLVAWGDCGRKSRRAQRDMGLPAVTFWLRPGVRAAISARKLPLAAGRTYRAVRLRTSTKIIRTNAAAHAWLFRPGVRRLRVEENEQRDSSHRVTRVSDNLVREKDRRREQQRRRLAGRAGNGERRAGQD